jgi:hypothetical protein
MIDGGLQRAAMKTYCFSESAVYDAMSQATAASDARFGPQTGSITMDGAKVLNRAANNMAEAPVPSIHPGRLTVRVDHLWLGLPVFALLCKVFMFPLPVLDFWWHLKMGEIIARTGSIPSVDLFSFTAAGKPFVVQNWLAELIFYGSYKVGGFPLIVFLTALIALCGLLFVYKLCLQATNNVRLAACLGLFAAAENYTFARPQAFSFLLFAAYYSILVGYRERRCDRIWQLPVLMILWVNLHGAFVLGLGLIALYIACETCRRFIIPTRTDALTWNEIRKLALVLLFCSAATLLNPETYKIYEYVRTVVSDPASQQFVAEWQPPRVNQLLGIVLFYGPWLSGLLIFVYAHKKPDLTETALFFGFGVFAMMATRNAAWFSIVAIPIMARYLPTLDLRSLLPLRRFRLINRIFECSERSDIESAGQRRLNVVIATLAMLVLVAQSPWIRPTLNKASLLDKKTPVGAADFIEQHGLSGHIFHAQIFGDYLIWRLWPKQKSFLDGRVHLFGLEFIRQYTGLLRDSHWEEILQRWDIRYMLLSKSPEEEDELKTIEVIRKSSRWTKLYEDDVSILFETAH